MTTTAPYATVEELRELPDARSRIERLRASGTQIVAREIVAAVLDVEPATIQKGKERGWMPDADGRLGRTPFWRVDTVAELVEQRISLGYLR